MRTISQTFIINRKSEGKKYQRAKLRYNGDSIVIKLKLKGDLEDHWGGNRYSVRVKMAEEETMFGLSEFALQPPYTRNYMNEWLFHRMLRAEGVMSLDFRFVKVFINGKDLKYYNMEQYFSDDIFKTNKVEKTVVVRFNEDEWAPLMLANVGAKRSLEVYHNAEVEVMNKNVVKKDPQRIKYFERATEILKKWRSDSISTSQAFDVEKMARFWAVSNIVNTGHANCWNNRRFYYNAQNDVILA